MKKAFLSLSMLLFWGTQQPAYSQGINFMPVKTSWKEILEKAKKDKKPLFIDVFTSWCPPCVYMNKQVFPQSEVGAFFNSRFINVRFNTEIGEGKQINEHYNIHEYPTFLFLSPDGVLVMQTAGSQDKNEIITLGEEALTKMIGNKPLSEWENEYKSHKKDAQFILSYINKRRSLRLPVKNEIEDYLSLLPEDSLKTTLVSHIITWNDISINGRAFQVLHNMYRKDPYSLSLTGPFFSMQRVFDNYIHQAINQKDVNILQNVIDSIKLVYNDPGICDRIISHYLLQYYAGVNDTEKFINEAQYYARRFLVSLNFDSLNVQDRRRLNNALLFEFKTNNPDSIKDIRQFNWYQHAYQGESDNVFNDLIFICRYICNMNPATRRKELLLDALNWLKLSGNLRSNNIDAKQRISEVKSCLQSD